MIFLIFSIYWELRDFWQYRWEQIDISEVLIKYISIPVSNGNLFAELIQNKYKQSKNGSEPLIIFNHGFSDNRFRVRHITVPLALAGYDVFVYDSRGVGKSRSTGNKNQFTQMVFDLGKIMEYLKNDSQLSSRPLYLIGTSIGSVASIYQGLRNDKVQKIIAVAAIANYNSIITRSPILFKRNWWIWFRYLLFRVPMYTRDETNHILSPILQLFQKKNSMDHESWLNYTANKLFFIHDLADPIITVPHFYQNRAICECPLDNWALTKKGGHIFQKYENVLIGLLLYILKQKKNPILPSN